jgi:iron complex transport system ATP-binding protein
MNILQLDRVYFSYNSNYFIEDLSIDIEEKEFIGLIGPNGSGKSTVLKLCAGILKPSSGRVLLWGRPLHEYQGRDRAKLISYLPQMLYTNLPFTVKEIVNMGLYPYRIMPSTTPDEALQMAGLLDKSEQLITELSGGERRRVFIAMTLLQGAGLLLLDEPLANLDIKYQIELITLLKRLRDEKGISIFMALHDINLVHHFDRVIVIKEGSIITTGFPKEVITEELISNVYGISVRIHKQEDGSFLIGFN